MNRLSLFLMACVMLLLGSCSAGNEIPIIPGENSPSQAQGDMQTLDRATLFSVLSHDGVCDALESICEAERIDTVFDREQITLYHAVDAGDGEMEVVPLRAANAHYNVNWPLLPPKCSDCIGIAYEWNIGGWWDYLFTARNPKNVTGYDVRVVLFTEYYPGPGIQSAVGDDWTPSLPTIYADYHPFAAFKTPNYRTFPPQLAWWTEFSIMSESPTFIFAVDASYPSNCQDPYEIVNYIQSNPLWGDGTGFCSLHVDVHDWQGNVGAVFIDLSFMGGYSNVPMTWIGGSTWRIDLGEFYLWPDFYPVIITAYTTDPVVVNSIRDLAFVEVW